MLSLLLLLLACRLLFFPIPFFHAWLFACLRLLFPYEGNKSAQEQASLQTAAPKHCFFSCIFSSETSNEDRANLNILTSYSKR